MAHVYEQAYFDSKIVPITEAQLSVTSAAVLYGLSVYTVLPVSLSEQGLVAFRLPEHFRRLTDSAKIIGLDTFPGTWTFERFENAVREVVTANAVAEKAFVRCTVHTTASVPGTRSRGIATALSIFVYKAEPLLPEKGARIKTSVWRRIPDYAIPSRAKVNGAYVNSVLAKQDALDSGYDDCIFLDTAGHVCELSAANLFMVREGMVITPGTESDILSGITRRTVFALAKDLGLPVVERTIDLTELYIADELFACGTSAGVTPIVEVDARKISVGPVTAELSKKYQAALSGTDEKHSEWYTVL